MLGDRDAFEAFILHNGPAILRYAQNMMAEDEVAATIVGDAFATAWETLDAVRRDVSLRTWLYASVTRETTAYRGGCDEVDVPDARESGCVRHHVSSALAGLPHRQRATWLLHEVEGVPLAEIGWILGCASDAARTHLATAKVALGEALTADGNVGVA